MVSGGFVQENNTGHTCAHTNAHKCTHTRTDLTAAMC